MFISLIAPGTAQRTVSFEPISRDSRQAIATAAAHSLLSTRKPGPEHRYPALRPGFGRFVLQNVPVLHEQSVGDAKDVRGNPVPRPSISREPAVDDYVLPFGKDQSRLVLQRLRTAPDKIEEAL